MRSNKVWTLIALAGLAIAILVRPDCDFEEEDDRHASLPVWKLAKIDQVGDLWASSDRPRAGSAWHLFRSDWSAVLWRVYQKLNQNRLLAVAAGVVFYGLLAIFPALTAFVSLYGLMADPSTINQRLSLATGVLPQGALNILNEQLTRLTCIEAQR